MVALLTNAKKKGIIIEKKRKYKEGQKCIVENVDKN